MASVGAGSKSKKKKLRVKRESLLCYETQTTHNNVGPLGASKLFDAVPEDANSEKKQQLELIGSE